MKHIVVLTGAGMSAESGIKTFRDHNGLWNDYRVEEVATPEAWARNMDLVIDFYNQRRKQLLAVEPNPAHYALARLEERFKVSVVTQNIDDLHERAGSTNVLHLHGELKKVRSSRNPDKVYELEGWELKKGDTCPEGSQLRPHVVWFGEPVPNIVPAAEICSMADMLLIIGTSMNVYPAAGLFAYTPGEIPKYYIDPGARDTDPIPGLHLIADKAGKAVPALVEKLLTGGSA
ncbi:MAG: NAD-dependent deacylase [Bacteroidales bacterium]